MNAKLRVAGFIAVGALAGALATTQLQAYARAGAGTLPLEELQQLAAVGRSATAGRIAAGRPADLVVLDAPSYVHLSYRLGTNLVRDVVRGGAIVVRDGRRVPA